MNNDLPEDHGLSERSLDFKPSRILSSIYKSAAKSKLAEYSGNKLRLTEEKNVRKHLLEALHHFCQAGDWQGAGEILASKICEQDSGFLFDRLRIWGFYEDVVKASKDILRYLDAKILDAGDYNPNWRFLCLKSVGDAYLAQGEYRQALDAYEQCLEIISKNIINKQAERTILDGIGSCYHILGDYEKSIKYHSQSLALSREEDDKSGEGYSLGNLGSVYIAMGEFDKARSYFERELSISRETDNRQSEGNSQGNLGNLEELLGNHDEARNKYTLYLEIAREMQDPQGQANALNGLGNVLLAEGKASDAVACYVECIDISKRIQNHQLMVTAYGSRGNANLKLGNYDNALSDHESCLAISKKIGDCRGQCRALEGKGTALLLKKMGKEAIEALREAQTVASELHDPRLEARIITRLGSAYYQDGDVVVAKNCNLSALTLLDKAEDLGTKLEALSNLGEIHYVLKDFINAEKYLEEYVAFLDVNRSRKEAQRYLGMLGHSYLSLKKHEEAEKMLRSVVGYRHENLHIAEMAANFANLAEACYAQDKNEDALDAFDAYAELVADHPEQISSDSAAGMCNLAQRFLALKEYGQAIRAARGSMALYEPILARDANGSSWTGYAVALNAMASALDVLKGDEQHLQIEEKLYDAFDHAYTSLLAAADDDEKSNCSILALTLNNASNRLSFLDGMDEKALSLAEKAVDLLQRLGRRDSREYGPVLAVSLYNLSRRNGQIGKADEARQLMERSLSMLRPFYENDPERYSEWMKEMEEDYSTRQ